MTNDVHDDNTSTRRIGLGQGQVTIPDDIHWGDDEIMRMFEFSEEDISGTYPDKAKLNHTKQDNKRKP
ncbi:Uncharacterised protein [Moraxella lacunata]|uniref:Uncharacterized protein n=1 Tax=Moraxella lacunata TaxID=477 RepID=A0A378TQP3_MORLA|nr:hypothetical protein [Moraxella lacunata]STZ63106.1 Uncharacterised protein [Moraxella lacunata]